VSHNQSLSTEEAPKLDRGLTLLPAIGIIIANVIGTGVFMKARVMTANVGTPSLVMAAWIAGGLLTLAGSLVFGELSAMSPRSGGPLNFIGAAYGRRWAFLFAWSRAIAYGAGIAAVAILTVTFLNDVLGGALSPLQLKIMPPLVIAFSAALNLCSVRATGGVAMALTGVKISILLTIAFGAFLLSDGSFSHFGMSGAAGAAHGVPESARLGLSGFGAAVAGALWGYNGWAIIASVGGEVRDPGRVLPRAMSLASLLVIGLYLLINASYFFALTPLEIADLPEHTSVAVATIQRFAGDGAASLLAIGLVISAYGTMHVALLVGARIPFAMTRQGLAPASLGKLNSKAVPAVSVVAIAIWSSVLALSGTFDILTDLTIFVLWLFVGLTGTTIFVLRRKFPDAPRPYRVLGYPVIPIAFLLATVFMLISMLTSTPGRCLAGVGLVLIGLPAYSLIARRLPPDDSANWIGVE